MHKITHLRAQNALGACEVQKFMNRQCQHIHVDSPQFNEEIVKARARERVCAAKQTTTYCFFTLIQSACIFVD